MKSLHLTYLLGGISCALTLVFFGIIDISPSSMRIATITQTAAINTIVNSDTTAASAVSATTTISTNNSSTPPSLPYGIISINFDDGWISSYSVGFPILKAAQLPATFYIISDYVGKSPYISKEDMLDLQAAGEEIGDHTKTHPILSKLTTVQMQDEILGSMNQLKADGVQSITTFAYPYGAHTINTDEIVKASGYTAARTIDNGMDSPTSNRYLLQSHEVMSNTTVAEVEHWIDTAVKHKQWLILVFHQLNPTYLPHDPYSWATPNFQTIVNYLASQQIPVMTNSAVIKTYFTQ